MAADKDRVRLEGSTRGGNVVSFEKTQRQSGPAVESRRQGVSGVWNEVVNMNRQANSDGLYSTLWMQREDCSDTSRQKLLDLALDGASGDTIREQAVSALQEQRAGQRQLMNFWEECFRWSLLFAVVTTAVLLLEIDATQFWNPTESNSIVAIPIALLLCGLASAMLSGVNLVENRRALSGVMYAEALVAIVEPHSAPQMRNYLDLAFTAPAASRVQGSERSPMDYWGGHIRA